MLIFDYVKFSWRWLTSRKFREEAVREYNRALFRNVPTSQMYILDGHAVRPLREDERTWPE